MKRLPALILAVVYGWTTATGAESGPALALEAIPSAQLELAGPVGERVKANEENWLMRAPSANPGMIEMFRVRDRRPVPKLVPWAGEFVGKYLISAVQALKLSKDPRLREQVQAIVTEFVATQADDGYLGPFPKSERLLKHWDLWGHYHALLALTLWHEYSGDPNALEAARKAADLVCATYLDNNRRVFDAGDHEMNMAMLTGMAMMHRITGEERYLRMAREIEKDWERAGDYVRTALDGREFYQTPRPRWESLHDLQGLIELWRITGETKYRDSFVHHWRSIRRWDRRNTGGFSSGEQATGNPFSPTAIETCCTVAWMALTVDYLRLTGDLAAADELELSTLNAGLGAQHPSGGWWTYNTPMDGSREASAHSIVFQARAGTPELNCCSVNGPRVLGMLSEWAIMSDRRGLLLNWLGAGRFTVPLTDGTAVTIISSDDAWLNGSTTWRIESNAEKEFSIRLRIPGWAQNPSLKLNGKSIPYITPGRSLEIKRAWKTDDKLEFDSRMAIRAMPGAREAEGKVSLYRGPLLLTFDQAHNEIDDDNIPAVELEKLSQSRTLTSSDPVSSRIPAMQPWLVIEVPTVENRWVRMVDYASAGAVGTRYRTWLPVTRPPPPPAFTLLPPDGARIPPGQLVFHWLGSSTKGTMYRLEFATEPSFTQSIRTVDTTERQLELPSAELISSKVGERGPIYWRVVTKAENGETTADVPPASFQLDVTAPPQKVPPKAAQGPNGEIIVDSLRGETGAEYGKIELARFSTRNREGTELNGKEDKLIYSTPWPVGDFTMSVTVSIKELPRGRIGQIFSAWNANLDDPLRVVVDNGKLFARMEAGSGYSTPGVEIEPGRTYIVTATKRDGTVTLYVDGHAIGSCTTPLQSNTQSRACALGGNPRFAGNECLAARFADFRFYARAFSEEEIRELTKQR